MTNPFNPFGSSAQLGSAISAAVKRRSAEMWSNGDSTWVDVKTNEPEDSRNELSAQPLAYTGSNANAAEGIGAPKPTTAQPFFVGDILGAISSRISEPIRRQHGFEERLKEARQLAGLIGISNDRRYKDQPNAIQHAYTSATLQRDYGQDAPDRAQQLGDWLERENMFMHQFKPIRPDQHADSWKDLWNNAIGRQIGEYVRKHNLSQNDLEQLIAQAYDRGELITETNDPRIPRNASGWPGRFPKQGAVGAPVWSGPSPDWKSMPGPGIAKMQLPPRNTAR